jgi:dTDP-4-dehydrorhamnose reductase
MSATVRFRVLLTMKILVTGAAGLVGHHLARRLARDHEVLGLKRGELDITNRDAVNHWASALKPSLIINCAVIQVDESEQNPTKAQAVNAEGPRFLAEAANIVGADIIHFGTQYTFDGEPLGRTPYTIEDEPRPVNTYGKTKIMGEEGVRQTCARSYIIRTSWVYGSGKNSFLCTVHDDLRAGKRVRAIVDIWSCTTYVEDLIDCILQILDKRRYGTYHIVNEGVCSYYEFALEAGRLVGLSRHQVDLLIETVKEAEMQRSALRPRYTPMSCLLSEKLGLPPMRDWRAALADYVRS